MRPIKRIIIHCTATRADRHFDPSDLEQSHRQRGFTQCGYHYYITTDGVTHDMRPIELQGAHAKGYNLSSIGIAYEGGLDSQGRPSDTRTSAQRIALRTLLTRLRLQFPQAKIMGHRDLSPDLNKDGVIEPREYVKQCPCFNAIPEYADI